MTRRVQIHLHPMGETFLLEKGVPLKDALFEYGVEFPCGGRGRCRGCRVRVLEGRLSITPEEEENLSREELDKGWRLACRHDATEDLTLELAQWQVPVLTDEAEFEFEPREGQGIAVDVGTTTLVAQRLDLETGRVLGVETSLNPQARFGSDIMSRIHHATLEEGRDRLQRLIREEVGRLVANRLVAKWEKGKEGDLSLSRPAVQEVVLVGNTAMHHLFCGLGLDPLAHAPFETEQVGEKVFSASDLGWSIAGDPPVKFLPCLGSFVGSDVLSGILATRLHESTEPSLLIDLGTNGEVVAGNRDRILCASTAAGPAFEGGRISMGMRAAEGALAGVTLEEGKMTCRVIGGKEARGICGSGLVDAAAAGLELGLIEASGRLIGGRKTIPLTPALSITQGDIRELQLAKAAMAAGIRILLKKLDVPLNDIRRVHLAGAFGNYVNPAGARRIGLVPFPPQIIRSAGNTALLGAKMALFGGGRTGELLDAILRKTEHVPLSMDEQFQEIYIDEMSFPESSA